MNNDNWKKEAFKAFALISQLGLVVVISILIPFSAGYFLDTRLDTGIIFKIIGLILGIAAGYWNGATTLKKFLKRL